VANILFIRVNPPNPYNPCDYPFAYSTHQLKLLLQPDKSSVSGFCEK
jgi:hypothetical protein